MKEDSYGSIFSSNVELLEDTRELTPKECCMKFVKIEN